MHVGSGTGGTNPGLPQNTDPKDAHRTDRLDDPEELLQRRRAKDPAAFDKVHGKNASFAEETEGKSGDGGENQEAFVHSDVHIQACITLTHTHSLNACCPEMLHLLP